jgi:hypothetical protein
MTVWWIVQQRRTVWLPECDRCFLLGGDERRPNVACLTSSATGKDRVGLTGRDEGISHANDPERMRRLSVSRIFTRRPGATKTEATQRIWVSASANGLVGLLGLEPRTKAL